MKYKLIIFAFLLFTFCNNTLHSQTITTKAINDGLIIKNNCEKLPEFPNGELAMKKYFDSKTKSHTEDRNVGLTAIVYVYFVINKDGIVQDAKVVKGEHNGSGLNEEALKIINSMPTWNPAQQNGKPISIALTYALRFELKY